MPNGTMRYERIFRTDLNSGTIKQKLDVVLMTGDKNALKLVVRVTRGHSPVDLMGGDVRLCGKQLEKTFSIPGRVLPNGICEVLIDELPGIETGEVELQVVISKNNMDYTPLILRAAVRSFFK